MNQEAGRNHQEQNKGQSHMDEDNNQNRKMHMQSNNQGNEKVEYAPLNYSVSELYMIRKESIAYSNEFILRRLSRCFQKIKKMKATGREKQLVKQYEQDGSEVRKSWRKVHDLFKQGSRVQEITQKKIDKMKARITKVKSQLQKDEIALARDIDISKIYVRLSHPQPSSSQKNLPK